MTIINTSPDRIIQLGYEGEDRVTVLRFRYGADWLENGEGIFHIRVRRHGEHTAYNAALVADDAENNCLLMTVTNTELSVKGSDEMQVVYSGADFVKKSPIYSYNVSRAVDEAVDPPAQDVYTQIIESLSDLQMDVQGKADVQTVSALADEITDLNSDVQGLQTAVQAKADTSTVTALSGTVSSLSDTTQQYMEYTNSAITDLQDNKASKSYVNGELATKANVQTVTALSGTVTDLQANKADKTYVDTELAGKASTAVATTSTNGLMSAQDKSKLDEVSLLKEQIYNSYPNVEAETGPVVSISDGADGIPVKSLVVGIEPVQSGTGDPSPDNVRPITGWTGANVTRTNGKESTDPDYVAQAYPIAFPSSAGTVYGGSLDVTNGVLTVDRAMVDLGTLSWRSTSVSGARGNRFYSGWLTNVKAPESVSSLQGLVCSEYAEKIPSAYNQAVQGITIYTNGSLQIYDSLRASMTAEEFKTAMSGVQLVYELATPQTYQLTPTEVKTLLGSNNIWADTGDTSLAYRADTKLYIDGICADCNSMLAPVESTYIATRNYTTGKLLIVDNTLYKVTANIANGGTITAGTNVVATTLSEVIASLS